MAADGEQAGVGFAELAADHGQVGDHADVLDAVKMVGDAHGPGEDGVFGLGVVLGGLFDLFARDAGTFDEGCDIEVVELLFEFGKVFTVLIDEILVVGVFLEDGFGYTSQQGDVASDVGLKVEAGDVRAEQQADRVGGDLEPDQAKLFEGIDDDDVSAASADFHQLMHEPGMVGRGVGADEKDQVAVAQVFQDDGGCAGAGDRGQPDARCLMAIVGAVVDVIGTVEPGKQLQKERGFVGRAAAHIEEGLIGRGGLELGGDFCISLGPGDPAIMGITGRGQKGMGESAGHFKLLGVKAAELVEAEFLEEVILDRALHIGDRGLNGFFTDRGEMARFIDHAALLPAHAEGAGFTGVF